MPFLVIVRPHEIQHAHQIRLVFALAIVLIRQAHRLGFGRVQSKDRGYRVERCLVQEKDRPIIQLVLSPIWEHRVGENTVNTRIPTDEEEEMPQEHQKKVKFGSYELAFRC